MSITKFHFNKLKLQSLSQALKPFPQIVFTLCYHSNSLFMPLSLYCGYQCCNYSLLCWWWYIILWMLLFFSCLSLWCSSNHYIYFFFNKAFVFWWCLLNCCISFLGQPGKLGCTYHIFEMSSNSWSSRSGPFHWFHVFFL